MVTFGGIGSRAYTPRGYHVGHLSHSLLHPTQFSFLKKEPFNLKVYLSWILGKLKVIPREGAGWREEGKKTPLK